MPYTNVSKPTGADYTNLNPVGKQLYDDINTIYDSASTDYDGTESGAWTNTSKPTGSVYTLVSKPT